MRRIPVLIVAVVALCGGFLLVPSAQSSDTPARVTWNRGPSLPSTWKVRWDTAVAYHPPSDRVVMFGGAPARPGHAWHNDTWLMNNNSWWKMSAPTPSGLTPRGGSVMAYFPPTGDLVLFGGADSSWPPFNETWLYNGARWRRGPAAPEGLQGRTGAMMAYHPPTEQLVMFGGSGDRAFTDTWLFDGTGWKEGPPPATWPEPGMLPRAFGGMTYDERVGLIVLSGGSAKTDSWYFNGTRWTKAPFLPDGLGPKERMDLEFHPGYNRSVMFGGLGPGRATDEVWFLERGGFWQELRPEKKALRPDLRFDAHLVWVDHLDRMLMIGGVHHRGTGTDVYRDTWWMD